MRDLIAVDLETTGFDPDRDRIVEIGAVRLRLGPEGVTTGERFSTLVDPGRPVGSAITRLTGIRDLDLDGAPRIDVAIAAFLRFVGPDACFLGHNVGFDLSFLERAGLPAGAERLDTADLASILLPLAPSYALQRLAADARIDPGTAHRALDDALTCAAVLGALSATARALPADVLVEAQTVAPLVSGATAEFFSDALAVAVRHGWTGTATGLSPAPPAPATARRASAATPDTATVFAVDGPLARALPGYEDRPEQRELALEIERTEGSGGVLVAEAGTGIGKSLAYLVPALARAAGGERVIVSTHTLPLQDQLMRHDLPALQAALGSDVPVAVLKGRSNYLCPRRWQLFRAQAATREEARLLLKTLVWRMTTITGDRAELNLLGAESGLWSRISADDESCTARRCAATRGGCHLERARADAATSGIVVVNHALLLHDARAGNSLLPDAEHVIIDEAHRLEDVASDAFGHRFETWRARRDLDRIARSPLVSAALRGGDGAGSELAETLRSEVARAQVLAGETFAALGALLDHDRPRLRITNGIRAGDERWLGIELAAERFVDALAAIRTAGERLLARGGDEDEAAELEGALKEHIGTLGAISHGIHDPREGEITWMQADGEGLGLYVAPAHVGATLRRTLVERHRSVVLTSATLGVAGTMTFALERFGVSDVAASLQLGSPFDHAAQSAFIVPTDIALPHEERFGADAALAITEIALALEGRTLVLFTAHGTMREVAARLGELETAGIAVLTQGVDGSRRAILERFAQGRAVLLGTQSFWEGVDLPGDLLRCVIIAKLPFPVPDDPLVQGRAERYEDPFTEYHLPQAALRLRQGYGRLIRTKSDRGAVVLLDRRILVKAYGPTFLASLPAARVQRVGLDGLAAAVAGWGTPADRTVSGR